MTRIIVNSTAASGHPANYRTPSLSTDSLVRSGCSTTDPYLLSGGAPALVRAAMSVETGYNIAKSTIPGSSMYYRSQNVPGSGQPNPWTSMSGYSALIIADNPNMSTWAYTPGHVVAWAQKAWAVEAEFLIWNPQAYGLNNGFTRQQILDYYDLQITRHEAWQDEVNSQLPADQKFCRLFPGANIYLSIMQDQIDGNAPTTTWYDDLYLTDDGIHMGDIGGYISSMVIASCVWGIDPFDLPDTCGTLDSGNPFTDANYIKGK